MATQSEPTDEELVEAFINGDTKAFSQIVERHREQLTYVAKSYTKTETDAQDIVQETFFKASNNLHKFRAEAKLSTWLNRLVRNSGYDYVHHRSNAQHHSFDGEVDDDRNQWLSHEPLMGIDTRLDIQEALENLQPEQREVWMLTEIGGYSLKDVAELALPKEPSNPGDRVRRTLCARRLDSSALIGGRLTLVNGSLLSKA